MPPVAAVAGVSDLPFIASILLAGARKGHFTHELLSQRNDMRETLHSIIVAHRMPDTLLSAEALVYKFGSERVGMSIMCGVTGIPHGIELYAMGVRKAYRERHVGRFVLDHLLARWLLERDVYARCFPASERLYQMLLRRDFEHLFTMPSGARVLRREQVHGERAA